MTKPSPNWLNKLPQNRLIAEFSLWSADLMNMAAEIRRIDKFVDIYHLDVADGHFSPALLLFPDQIAAARKLTSKPFHVHLMATDDILLDQIDQFVDAGADLISIHAENNNWEAGLLHIENSGIKTGIVVQLDTPIEALRPMVPQIDMLTLLGTRIGVKGQSLDKLAIDRLQKAACLIAEDTDGRRVVLAADGAIREHTVPELRSAGAETIVMGSLAFNATDLETRIQWVHKQKKAV